MTARPIWLGTHAPRAHTGVPLKDNGVCAVSETRLEFAVSEERLSGRKHDPGHRRAFAAAAAAVPGADLRALGASSCTDLPWAPKHLAPPLSGLRVVPAPSHHHSHALSALALSPFDDALVLVMDAGGNTLGAATPDWWRVPREQTSVWLGRGTDLVLVERRHAEPGAGGFGEWYRAITYYLGWHRSTLAGNTMALAAFGDPERIAGESLFDLDPAALPPLAPNEPIAMVRGLLAALGHRGLAPRAPREPNAPAAPGEPIRDGHRHLAAYLQWSLETTVVRWAAELVARHGVPRLCLTGGVAQNCVANAAVAAALGPANVYVSPIAGDVGQCVGNALHARAIDLPGAPRVEAGDVYAGIFLGPSYGDEDCRAALRDVPFAVEHCPDDGALAARAAEALAAGRVVAVCRGRSELGPRALGHRSVLGDPCAEGVAGRIKRAVKRRDEFMPLAPVVDPELAAAWGDAPVSRTMVYAARAPDAARAELGACVHADGTARVQVADPAIGLMWDILGAFRRATGRGALINTSFNRRGKPIVETPADAVAAFAELDIDALVLGPYWVARPG